MTNQASPRFDTLIFLHVPKSGGTSVRQVLEGRYPPERVILLYAHSMLRGSNRYPYLESLPDDVKRCAGLMCGHFNFGLHAHLPTRCRYFTLLREPVSRVVSIYRHAEDHPEHPLHDAIRSGTTIRELLDRDPNEYRNAQTRAVAGLDLPIFLQTPPGDALAQAKRNLDEHFVVAGTIERFDESLAALATAMAWRGIGYRPTNVTPGRSRRSRIDDALRAEIAAANTLDAELHRYASRKLDETIAAQGVRFRAALAALQLRNRAGAAWRKLRRA